MKYEWNIVNNSRNHKGAISVLGEPIEDTTIDEGDESKSFTEGTRAQSDVPVWGSIQRGTPYFWPGQQQPQNKWIVSMIELELTDDLYKRNSLKGTYEGRVLNNITFKWHINKIMKAGIEFQHHNPYVYKKTKLLILAIKYNQYEAKYVLLSNKNTSKLQLKLSALTWHFHEYCSVVTAILKILG